MDTESDSGCWVAIGLVIGIVLVITYGIVIYSKMEGFCEGAEYDGVQKIDGKWCCYRGEDGSFVAVPISVLKGE